MFSPKLRGNHKVLVGSPQEFARLAVAGFAIALHPHLGVRPDGLLPCLERAENATSIAGITREHLRVPNQHDIARLVAVTLISLALSSACGEECLPPPEGNFFTLEVENSAGRHGTYYLPVDYAGEALPLMVIFHGTNGSGLPYAELFAPLADRDRFLIIAPDSRVAPNGQYSWEVGDDPGEATEDFVNTIAAIIEVEGRSDVQIDWRLTLAAGHSGGASSAPYLATNDGRFTHFAVLHGGIITGGLGGNVVPGWFATGEDDTLRTPSHVQQHVDTMRQIPGFDDITYVIYPGGHQPSVDERLELVEWWLH